ncbi:MAG: histidinol-phosphatase [Ruminococcus sp.]|nr:histidinol-phosphatase [Ruminococcus sp.]
MYFYEMHLHTSEGSECGGSGGAEQALYYKSLGYDGIFVTDHFFNGNSRINFTMPDESWGNKIEAFCKGYENAKKKGDEIGLSVFFGFEYAFHGTEWLIYGLSKEWLLENPHIMEMSPREFLEYVKKCGGFVIQAHPFREASYIDTIRILPHHIDGMEILNTKNTDRANAVAELFTSLNEIPVTCGSDCHHDKDGNLCAMGCEHKINSVSEFFERLENGELSLFRIDERGSFKKYNK